MERAVEVFAQNFDDYLEESATRVIAAGIPVYANIPRDVLRTIIGRAFSTVLEDIRHGTTSNYTTYMGQVGKLRAQNGTPIAEMISGLNYGFQTVTDHFEATFGDDLAPRLWWEERRREISYAGALAVTDSYYTAREALIRAQNHEIMRLAAPLIPIHAGVLLLPVVGAINAERAANIIESLLDGIARQRSHVVILDVTGMYTTDESATDHLINAAHAARLLGAQVILVGIRPEVARTFARTGVNLGGITILGDLTSGVDHALRLRGLAITSVR
jgi:rsbT co-antagonist protein RsbR